MADIDLLFGVDGGGSIDGASGKNIEKDIKTIVTALEGTDATKIVFSVDTKSIDKIKVELKEVGEISKNISLNVDSARVIQQIQKVQQTVASSNTMLSLPTTLTLGSGDSVDEIQANVDSLRQQLQAAVNSSSVDVRYDIGNGDQEAIHYTATIQKLNQELGITERHIVAIDNKGNVLTTHVQEIGKNLNEINFSKITQFRDNITSTDKQLNALVMTTNKLDDSFMAIDALGTGGNYLVNKNSLTSSYQELIQMRKMLLTGEDTSGAKVSLEQLVDVQERFNRVLKETTTQIDLVKRVQTDRSANERETQRADREVKKNEQLADSLEIIKNKYSEAADFAANYYTKIKQIEIDTKGQTVGTFTTSAGVKTPVTFDDFKQQYAEVEKLQAALSNTATYQEAKVVASELEKANKALTNSYYALTNAYQINSKKMSSENTETRRKISSQTQYQNILRQATAYYNKNAIEIKKNVVVNKEWQQYLNQIKLGNFEGGVTGARNKLSELRTECLKTGIEAVTLKDRIKQLFSKQLGSTLIATSIGLITTKFRDMYQNVVLVDSAMTELRKTTEETEDTYIRFLDEASDRAQKLGGTLSDVVYATADFTRLGYSLVDSTKLADAAILYKNVADGLNDINESTQTLISTMKAFDIVPDDISSIVDMFNEVGNNYAISSADIGTALQRSASALSEANNTVAESVALIVGMNSTLQDAEKTGTVLKTLTMYLRAASTEAEDAGIETEGMAKSVSKLRNELMSLTGIDIMVDDENFKNTYQIVGELSQIWKGLKDIDKANVLNLLGGKRNANAISALITNFKDSEASLQTALNSEGSANKENETYLDSIKGKVAQLEATFQSLSTTIMNSDLIKGGITFLNGVLGAINGIGDSLMGIPALLTTISAVMSAKFNVGKHILNMPPYVSLHIYIGQTRYKISFPKLLEKAKAL